MQYLKHLVAALVVTAMAACGGGGGSSGASSSGSGSGSSDPPTGATGSSGTTVQDFIFTLDQNSINNSGTDDALLTVTALDSRNNPVSGVPVSVSVDSGIYTPATTTTDASGRVSGAITVGGSKANRNITASVTIGSRTKTAVLAVTGGDVTITPVPATLAPGAAQTLNIRVVDSASVGIAGASVVLTGTLGYNQTVTTDFSGNATASLAAAPAAAGTYSIIATSNGIQSRRDVQVVASGGGGIPAAVGPIASASLQIAPNTIAPNAAGSTTNRATLRAKFQTASNAAVQNVRVRFELVAPVLGNGESITTGSNTVYSDAAGEAVADYVAGTRSSPTNGVTIRACYGLTDASIAGGACPNFVIQTMTVAGSPLSVTIGDNNLLEPGVNALTYIKRFVIAVNDSAGNAVSGAVITASVDILAYGKGGFTFGEDPADQDPPFSYNPASTNTTVPSLAGGRVICLNEDTNRNGFLDAGEDINGNGNIEPRKADIILSFQSSNTTNSSGQVVIRVEYPQNVATWEFYRIRATTSVAGSEGTAERDFATTFIDGDLANGSFRNPPYGTGRCVDAN